MQANVKSNNKGRGSERQAKVLVMVESEPSISAPKKGQPYGKSECLKNESNGRFKGKKHH